MRSLALTLMVLLVLLVAACGDSRGEQLKELQRVKAAGLDIVLLSPGDALKRGKGSFVLEFRDANNALVDVGMVKVAATMPMAGMAPMFGDCTVLPTPTRGRYEVASDLGMAGTWRLQVSWNGPGGQGSVSLPGSVL